MNVPSGSRLALSLLFASALAVAACDGTAVTGEAWDQPVDPGAPPDLDAPTDPSVPGDPGDPDDLPDVPDEPGEPPSDEPDDPTVPPTPDPVPALPSGETDGDAVIVDAALLGGVFLYGVGADPGGALASLGGTASGIAPVPVVLELVDSVLTLRALDSALSPVEGEGGVVARYAYELLADDRVRVDLSEPLEGLTIHVFGSCVLTQASFTPAGAPVFADGLLTWPATETFTKRSCPQWMPSSIGGLHVHYLRHADASRGFDPRAVDGDSPFGFFLTGGTNGQLARLPIDANTPDGAIVYHLSASWPEMWVPAAEATFGAWNDALETAIGVRPFAVAHAPADMIAWDPRHHVVLWDDSSGSGAIAPFAADPFTGEIVHSFVVMWFGEIERLVERYARFFEDHPEVASVVMPVLPDGPPAPDASFDLHFDPPGDFRVPADLPAGVLRRQLFHRRPLSDALVRRTVAELHRDLTDDEIVATIVQDFLVHEIGHNLGLRHNFIGSVDRRRERDGDTSSTVMDYVIGQMEPGAYDLDAMRYAYGDGPSSDEYLYCTDEELERDPGCAQWDFGHPVHFWLDYLDALMAANPPGTSTTQLANRADREEWASTFTRIRRFLNTDYEIWAPDADIRVYEWLVDRVVCEGECPVHTWFRSQLALYTLYTRHAVRAVWEPGAPTVWFDFPALDETQAALLMNTYFDLVTDAAQPLTLKTTIIGKLPTAALPGAETLLVQLHDHFAALDTPSTDERALLDAVEAALAE